MLLGAYFFSVTTDKKDSKMEVPSNANQQPSSSVSASSQSASDSISSSSSSQNSSSSAQISTLTKLDVPFIVQAPFGNWSDPVFQNACEEASIVMAMGWVNGTKSISPQDAKTKIQDIVSFENKNFGYSIDTDVFDIKKIFNQHFNLQNVNVKENITLADIKNALSLGNLVLVPAFGQALHNPNYTAPGPIAHMLVIIGYDPTTEEFITNDTGTKHGAGYRYNENTLFGAIWSYPSGKKVPDKPTGKLKKAMIMIQK